MSLFFCGGVSFRSALAREIGTSQRFSNIDDYSPVVLIFQH